MTMKKIIAMRLVAARRKRRRRCITDLVHRSSRVQGADVAAWRDRRSFY
jgi:hypothetical protein